MRVRSSYIWQPRRPHMDIVGAVEDKCRDYSSDGSVERAAGTARDTAVMLGRLVHMLHTSTVLSDAQVLELLGDAYEAVPSDESQVP